MFFFFDLQNFSFFTEKFEFPVNLEFLFFLTDNLNFIKNSLDTILVMYHFPSLFFDITNDFSINFKKFEKWGTSRNFVFSSSQKHMHKSFLLSKSFFLKLLLTCLFFLLIFEFRWIAQILHCSKRSLCQSVWEQAVSFQLIKLLFRFTGIKF